MKPDWTMALFAANGYIRKLTGLFNRHQNPRGDSFPGLRVGPPTAHFTLIYLVDQTCLAFATGLNGGTTPQPHGQCRQSGLDVLECLLGSDGG